MARIVTIQGTWSRTNTSREDVFWYRRQLRERARRRGIEVDFSMPNSQRDDPSYNPKTGQGSPGTKSGTFKATIPLWDNFWTPDKNARVAKLVLEALQASVFCRGAKLKIDKGKTETRIRNNDVAGIL